MGCTVSFYAKTMKQALKPTVSEAKGNNKPVVDNGICS